jgi:hypothetical protein
VGDVQFVLTNDGRTRVTQQLIVVKQATGYRILYRQHADGRRVLLDRSKDLLERRATDQLHLLTLEIQMGCYIVERPHHALYRYSLHILFIKNSAFTL